MKVLVALILIAIALPAWASEIWVSSGWVYTGARSDDDANGLDTRIKFPFEVQWKSNKAYFEIGGLKGYEPYSSYTYVGGGIATDPFPNKAPWLELQFGVEFGRATIHNDQAMRFKVGVYYVRDRLRLGWAHRSNGRGIFNLGNERNEAIEGIYVGYCARGC